MLADRQTGRHSCLLSALHSCIRPLQLVTCTINHGFNQCMRHELFSGAAEMGNA